MKNCVKKPAKCAEIIDILSKYHGFVASNHFCSISARVPGPPETGVQGKGEKGHHPVTSRLQDLDASG